MPQASTLAGLVPTLVAAYLCLLGPGHAWWHGRASALPRLFARVALSVAVTSLIGLVLAMFDAFSLPRVVALSAMVTLAGYLQVGRVRYETPAPPSRTGIGVVVLLAALWVYWPAYEAHYAASDSSAYTAGGLHLARSHQLWKHDDIAEHLPPLLRWKLFSTVLDSAWKPPYARMPGGLVIDSPTSDVVRPAFFPLPVVWSALFADALGGLRSGGYTPLFCALALWATWYFARRRLGAVGALVTTALVGLNAASYWAGKMPLSEPLAWFFLWSGLVALDGWEDEGFAADARLGGLLLGLAGTTRIEFLLFIVGALAIRRLLGSSAGSRGLTLGFCVLFALTIAATVAQAWTLRGAYMSPLVDALRGVQYLSLRAWADTPAALLGGAAAALALAAVSVKRFGMLNALLFGALAGFVIVYTCVASHPRVLRSLDWLTSYLGWAAMLLAVPGLVIVWRRRFQEPGNGLFVILVVFFGGLLIYNPHVLPAMPWASRRFVPLLIPALLVFAAISSSCISRRTLLGGALAWLLLIVGVLGPLPALWNRNFYETSHEQLAEFAALVPKNSVLLIDARLAAFVLSTPLWLAYDLNSLPVEAANLTGRSRIRAATASLGPHRPVFLIKPTLAPAEPIAGLSAEHHADYTFAVLLPEQTAARPPRVSHNYIQPVSIYRLESRPGVNRQR